MNCHFEHVRTRNRISTIRKLGALYGKKGRRRAMGPLEIERCVEKIKRIYGSSSTAVRAMTYDKNLDQMITHGMCLIYSRQTLAVFDSCLRLSVNWDPGSYSGFQYNCGLAYSLEADVAAVVPPRVGAS